jgi:hypothetical protein
MLSTDSYSDLNSLTAVVTGYATFHQVSGEKDDKEDGKQGDQRGIIGHEGKEEREQEEREEERQCEAILPEGGHSIQQHPHQQSSYLAPFSAIVASVGAVPWRQCE